MDDETNQELHFELSTSALQNLQAKQKVHSRRRFVPRWKSTNPLQETAMSFDVADQPPLEQVLFCRQSPCGPLGPSKIVDSCLRTEAAPEACPGELTEPAVDRLQQDVTCWVSLEDSN